jgi:hypothetical protein
MAEEETSAKAEEALERAFAMLQHAAARQGLHLTVQALKKAEEVLKLELAGDREKALEANVKR